VAIDNVQPPDIGISPSADIAVEPTIVTAMLGCEDQRREERRARRLVQKTCICDVPAQIAQPLRYSS
jgi:hypothetical protein